MCIISRPDRPDSVDGAPFSHLFRIDSRTLDVDYSSKGGVYGKKIQEKCISFVSEYRHLFSSVRQAIIQCSAYHKISSRQIRRWWKHFEFYYEVPDVTRKFYLKLRKTSPSGTFSSGSSVFSRNTELLGQLESILKNYPEYYLDQFCQNSPYHCGC